MIERLEDRVPPEALAWLQDAAAEVAQEPAKIATRFPAVGRKVGGINTVRLTWTGAISNQVDVFRNNVLIVTTANDGSYTDSTGDTGRARYTYRVCEAGTQTCSNNVRVTFQQ